MKGLQLSHCALLDRRAVEVHAFDATGCGARFGMKESLQSPQWESGRPASIPNAVLVLINSTTSRRIPNIQFGFRRLSSNSSEISCGNEFQ